MCARMCWGWGCQRPEKHDSGGGPQLVHLVERCLPRLDLEEQGGAANWLVVPFPASLPRPQGARGHLWQASSLGNSSYFTFEGTGTGCLGCQEENGLDRGFGERPWGTRQEVCRAQGFSLG